MHTAQLEFGTKTAALQLSGHHACTSRMWETRKLKLGQFKKMFLLFCHLMKLQYAQSLVVGVLEASWVWDKNCGFASFGYYAWTSRMWETQKLELGQFKKIFLLFCHLIKLAYMVAYGVQYAQSLVVGVLEASWVWDENCGFATFWLSTMHGLQECGRLEN